MNFSKLTGLVVCAALCSGTAWVETRSPADESELDQHMLVIEDHLTTLRRGLRKPEKNAESLVQIAEMQQAALASKLLAPRMTESLPDAERAAFVVAYRKEMITTLRTMLDLEEAVLDSDNERAQELYKALKLAEDSGHEKFTADG